MSGELKSILWIFAANLALLAFNFFIFKKIQAINRDIAETYNCTRAWIACYQKEERGF